jgi:hypothetical protein
MMMNYLNITQKSNKVEKVYSIEYTEVTKAFFTSHPMGVIGT